MISGRTDKREHTQVIALVEFDMREMRVRFVLAREAIKERMRELDHARTIAGKRPEPNDVLDNCGLDKMRRGRRAS
jgi:hypothetical protein